MRFLKEESLFHRVLQVQKGDCADASKCKICNTIYKILKFPALQLKNKVGIGYGVANQPLALLANLIENIIATLHFVQ